MSVWRTVRVLARAVRAVVTGRSVHNAVAGGAYGRELLNVIKAF